MTLPQNLVRAMRIVVSEWDDLHIEDAPAMGAAVEVLRGYVNREDGRAKVKRKVGGRKPAGKPSDDIPAEYREIVERRSMGNCEARTEDCEGSATQIHHVAGRGWKGCHEPFLLLHVCGMGNATGCHGWIHRDRKRAEAAGFLAKWGPR